MLAFVVSAFGATEVVNEKLASAGFARPEALSVAVQVMLTSEPCHKPSGAPHWIVGGVVSTTIMLKLPLAVLLWLLVAEQFTCVLPNANCEPEAGVQTGVIGPSFGSLALAV